MPRHPNDTLEQPWPGCADKTSPQYVPVELRDVVAAISAEVEQRVRHELVTVRGTMTRQVGTRLHSIEPHLGVDDFEIAVKWRLTELARTRLAGDEADQARREHDEANYKCACCGEVRTPGAGIRSHTMFRRFADGTSATTCGSCAAVLEREAVDRLASETIDGTTRLDRARRLMKQPAR